MSELDQITGQQSISTLLHEALQYHQQLHRIMENTDRMRKVASRDRLASIVRALEGGATVTEVARVLGLSRSAVYNILEDK